jgi:hypothetical protein
MDDRLVEIYDRLARRTEHVKAIKTAAPRQHGSDLGGLILVGGRLVAV